jgi:hypothetical protein
MIFIISPFLRQPKRRYFEATMARFTRLRATLRFYLEWGMKRQPPCNNDASLFAFFECRFNPEPEYIHSVINSCACLAGVFPICLVRITGWT